jgi:hypothetical protein
MINERKTCWLVPIAARRYRRVKFGSKSAKL